MEVYPEEEEEKREVYLRHRGVSDQEDILHQDQLDRDKVDEVKMKRSLGLALVLLSSLLSLGQSIQCYSCQDYSGTCSKTRDCSQDDACLTLRARGGDTYRACVKYSDCVFDQLSLVYSQIPTFKFSCCTSDLCNSAPVGSASVLIGLLCSLLAMWWTAH